MQEKIEQDLKKAMLAGDKKTVEVLKGIKSALQYEAVSGSVNDRNLSDEQVQKVLAREAKKRLETAEIYKKAGENERAEVELAERKIIQKYLPEQLSEEEVIKIVDEEVSKVEGASPSDMGRIIGAVRGRVGASSDGALIARLVKEKLAQ
jgi:uncharacterized protein YqeY